MNALLIVIAVYAVPMMLAGCLYLAEWVIERIVK